MIFCKMYESRCFMFGSIKHRIILLLRKKNTFKQKYKLLTQNCKHCNLYFNAGRQHCTYH